MELKITGIVKQLLVEQTGTSAKGKWRKREFILTTEGEYPKQICMVQWGNSIDKVAIGVGERITVSIDISSREYNGRWYTDVKARKVERAPEHGLGVSASAAKVAAGVGDPDDNTPF
jgi:hypothetical protein